MAPNRRGRKPALSQEFLEQQGWKAEVKERAIGGHKDKYWEHSTGKKCRSTAEVKRLMDVAGSTYYIEPSAQVKREHSKITVPEPTPTSPGEPEHLRITVPELTPTSPGEPEHSRIIVPEPTPTSPARNALSEKITKDVAIHVVSEQNSVALGEMITVPEPTLAIPGEGEHSRITVPELNPTSPPGEPEHSRIIVLEPTLTSPARNALSEEITKDVAVHVISEQNSVAPAEIIDNTNAHRDVGQEAGAQEQHHHRQRSFDLNDSPGEHQE